VNKKDLKNNPFLNISIICNCIFFLFIIVLYFNYLYQANKFSNLNNPWLIGDWLINYKSGFVRRGLGGEIFLSANKIFKINLNNLVFYFQAIVFFLVCCLLVKIVNKVSLDYYFLLLLISPTALSFSLYDAFMVGRKDILIILYFLYLVYLLVSNKKLTYLKSAVILFFSIFLILVSELIIFYLPYFFYLTLIHKLKTHDNSYFKINIIQSFIILIIFILIALFGVQGDKNLICQEIIRAGGDNILCSASINDINLGILDTLNRMKFVVKSLEYFPHYLIVVFLSILPINFYLFFVNRKIISCLKFNFLFILAFIFSLPLFVLSQDWGRWIHIHVLLSLFTLIILFYYNHQKEKRFIQKLKINRIYIFLPYMLYVFSWNTWNCCPKLTSLNLYHLGFGFFERSANLYKLF